MERRGGSREGKVLERVLTEREKSGEGWAAG